MTANNQAVKMGALGIYKKSPPTRRTTTWV